MEWRGVAAVLCVADPSALLRVLCGSECLPRHLMLPVGWAVGGACGDRRACRGRRTERRGGRTRRRGEFRAGHAACPVSPGWARRWRRRRDDAVLLVTPPDGHLARQIFAAGLPLLAEKPLTLDLARPRCRSSTNDLAQARLPLDGGAELSSARVAEDSVVCDGSLGEVGFGQFTYQRNCDGCQPRLNKYPLTIRHPMMLEQSIHHLDPIRFATAREVESGALPHVESAVGVYARIDSGVSCLLRLARRAGGELPRHVDGQLERLRFEGAPTARRA